MSNAPLIPYLLCTPFQPAPLLYSGIYRADLVIIRIGRCVIRISLPLVLDDFRIGSVSDQAVYPPPGVRDHGRARLAVRQRRDLAVDLGPGAALVVGQLDAVVGGGVHRQDLEAQGLGPVGASLVEAGREGGDVGVGADVPAQVVPDVAAVAVDDLRQTARRRPVEDVHAPVAVRRRGRRVRLRQRAVVGRSRQVHLDDAAVARPPVGGVLVAGLPDAVRRLPVEVDVLVAEVALLSVRDERRTRGADVAIRSGRVYPVRGWHLGRRRDALVVGVGQRLDGGEAAAVRELPVHVNVAALLGVSESDLAILAIACFLTVLSYANTSSANAVPFLMLSRPRLFVLPSTIGDTTQFLFDEFHADR